MHVCDANNSPLPPPSPSCSSAANITREQSGFKADDGGEITDLLCTTFPFVKGFEKMEGGLLSFDSFDFSRENPVAVIFDNFSVSVHFFEI
jgi:hypothetical protein